METTKNKKLNYYNQNRKRKNLISTCSQIHTSRTYYALSSRSLRDISTHLISLFGLGRTQLRLSIYGQQPILLRNRQLLLTLTPLSTINSIRSLLLHPRCYFRQSHPLPACRSHPNPPQCQNRQLHQRWIYFYS